MTTLVGLQDSVFAIARDLRAKGFLANITIDNDYIAGKVASTSNPYMPLTILNINDGQKPQNVERFIADMKMILESKYEQA